MREWDLGLIWLTRADARALATGPLTYVMNLKLADPASAPALATMLGATPQQVSAAISVAQVLPALPGALAGIPLGIGLFSAASSDGGGVTVPPAWWLAAAVLATLLAVAALTAIPARAAARRPAAAILQSGTT